MVAKVYQSSEDCFWSPFWFQFPALESELYHASRLYISTRLKEFGFAAMQ